MSSWPSDDHIFCCHFAVQLRKKNMLKKVSFESWDCAIASKPTISTSATAIFCYATVIPFDSMPNRFSNLEYVGGADLFTLLIERDLLILLLGNATLFTLRKSRLPFQYCAEHSCHVCSF